MSAEPQRVRSGLRPLPFRGDLIAAGAIPLAVGALLVDGRMAAWSPWIRATLTAVVAALLLVLAWRAPVEAPAPRSYVSVLLVCGFPLAAAALLELAAAIGLGRAATATLVALAVGAGYVALARARGSAICTLLGAASLVVAVVAGWTWVFATRSATPERWLLLVAILALALGVVAARDRHRAHAVALADVAGLAAVYIGVSAVAARVVGEAFSLGGGGWGWGWELVLLLTGFGLVGYGLVDHERGPAWLGAVVLGLFTASAATGGSLLWWPLVLVLLGGAAIGAGLRPTTPTPPSPDRDAEPAEERRFTKR